MTQTAAPERCSSGSNSRPLASCQLPVSNQALLLPMTLVAQLRPFAITVTPARASGATAWMPPICAATASGGAAVKAGAPRAGRARPAQRAGADALAPQRRGRAAALTRRLLAPAGRWVAMKGKAPTEELAAVGWPAAMFHVEPLQVPGLDAERCLVWMRPRRRHSPPA